MIGGSNKSIRSKILNFSELPSVLYISRPVFYGEDFSSAVKDGTVITSYHIFLIFLCLSVETREGPLQVVRVGTGYWNVRVCPRAPPQKSSVVRRFSATPSWKALLNLMPFGQLLQCLHASLQAVQSSAKQLHGRDANRSTALTTK